jgi:hypothetical protein
MNASQPTLGPGLIRVRGGCLLYGQVLGHRIGPPAADVVGFFLHAGARLGTKANVRRKRILLCPAWLAGATIR